MTKNHKTYPCVITATSKGEDYIFNLFKKHCIAVVRPYMSKEHINKIMQAYEFAKDAHKSQMRASGDFYIIHPVEVACILAKMHLDYETIVTALLHDVIEDTKVTYEDVEKAFGKSIAELVNGVSKLDKLTFRNKREAEAENFRKMVMAMVQDIRVILVKLADRTHNMRTLSALKREKQRRIANETIEIYAPLAHRLGINHLKTELEDLSFRILYPNRYHVISEVVKLARGNRKEMINNILNTIKEQLSKANILCRVMGREKPPYSIYTKMRSKDNQFHSIMDIYAFRVIVKDVDTCYLALGKLHALYKPRPGRVKDYIAIPKANGYQSLHTVLIGPHGVPVEVQIRTEEMDNIAEMGIAAHWSYKESTSLDTSAQIKARRWMQSLIELQNSASNSLEFIENVKSDIFPEEIYVFTPKGKIVELPVNSTPVDFAYAVHTDIGHSCISAYVDHEPYPLSAPLTNGQTIEIITSSRPYPNAAWLNFVRSGKARCKIRQQLKQLRHEESVQQGLFLLERALKGKCLSEIPKEDLQREIDRLKYPSLEKLLADIGLGNVLSIVIARNLLQGTDEDALAYNNDAKLPIKGAGMLVNFAKCCRPIPGDPIVAYISPGKGLVIHNEACRNIVRYQKEKLMPVEWSQDVNRQFVVEIKVKINNLSDVWVNLLSAIYQHGYNIHGLNSEEKEGNLYNVTIRLSVDNKNKLEEIMAKLRDITGVINVQRYAS